jgi:copper chaperone CopZ
MKKVILIFLAALFAIQINAQFTKATLQATGLTCAMCSNAINKALQAVPFIETVDSDIKNSAFNMVFKKDAQVNIDVLKAAVVDAGFSVGSLKVTGNFNEVKISNDAHVKLGNENFHFMGVKDQILNGEATLTIQDKDFVTSKQFKKIKASSKMECVKDGKAASCCEKDGIPVGTRVYHVTI